MTDAKVNEAGLSDGGSRAAITDLGTAWTW